MTITTEGINATTTLVVPDDSVAFAKIQNIATGKLLGRSTAGSGDIEEITVGSGLTLSAGTLTSPGGAGEANTASNVGAGGVGVFKQKTALDLEFKKINAGSSKITITDDTGNNEVDIDIGTLLAADIPNLAASKITSGQIALARGGTNADLNATGGSGQYLKQSGAGAAVTVGVIPDADLPATLAGKTLTTPTIASFVNATHTHQDAAGGGTLDAAAIASGTLDANRVPTHTGDVTGQTALTIANDAVTFAKMQNINTGKLLGRSTAASGDVEEIAIGSGLSLSAGTLSGTGGAASWTETEVDFGTKPKSDASFTVTDAAVTGSSKIIVLPCAKPTSGRTADDWQWDGITLAANPGTGSFALYCAVIGGGSVVGARKIQYQVA